MTVHPSTANAIVLTDAEQATLRCMAGHVIPASADLGVPGADDPAIFADIVRSLGRNGADVRQAIVVVDASAGGSLPARSKGEQGALLTDFRGQHPALAAVVGAAIARCYYRDDRVMRAIGMELRPPFPVGFEVEQGDWSMLEPVRRRGRLYRDAGEGSDGR